MHQELTILQSGLRFPEGPVAMSDGSVLFVEIEAGEVSSIDTNGTKHTHAQPGGGPNGMAIGPDGAAYICNNGGFDWHVVKGFLLPKAVVTDKHYSGGRIEKLNLKTGKLEVIYSQSEHGPLNGPNDIAFDSDGGFWFTDLGKYRENTIDRGAVYYASADGSFIERAIFPMITPNGIGLSPDEQVLYVAESATARLWSFALKGPGKIDPVDWPSPNGGTLLYTASGYCVFDSLALEKNGNVCVGTLVTGEITVISPQGGFVESIRLPDRFPTNLCFGGTDIQTAFITLSGTGQLASMQWPRPGLKLHHSSIFKT